MAPKVGQLSEHLRQSTVDHDHLGDAVASVFRWRGGRIVLLGHFADDRWTLARGWLTADAMTDVRRWNFAAPRAFAGQVRRLVLEATDDPALARAHFATALVWAETQLLIQQS